ncbi:TetR family transcriptional regulator [Nocardia sp. R7R-8]|uniref:TetR family transcriptional regulator n=1 Tax=Nocardia sp. R7R-8 TaxID=3459304 RepID=UPI00403DF1CC
MRALWRATHSCQYRKHKWTYAQGGATRCRDTPLLASPRRIGPAAARVNVWGRTAASGPTPNWSVADSISRLADIADWREGIGLPVPFGARVGFWRVDKVSDMSTSKATPATTPGRERQRATTIRRVIEAAESLLVEGVPFASMSVEQVISRAGVARSTFYAHFDDLGHLLRALGEGVVTEIIEAARLWMDLDEEMSRERLNAAFGALVSTYLRREKLLAALAEASTADPVVRDEFHRLLDAGHVELAKHISRGQESGVVRLGIDPGPTAGWLVWMLERGLYQQIRVAPAAEVQRHTTALTEIIWSTLYSLDR